MVKKITMMQQRSNGQRSAVDSRRRLTNFKMLVSQSMSAVLRQSVELLLNVTLSPQSSEKHVNNMLRMLPISVTFLDFQLLQVV